MKRNRPSLPRRARRSPRPRATKPRRATKRQQPVETVFADGSKLLTDQSGHILGLVEARTPYRSKLIEKRKR